MKIKKLIYIIFSGCLLVTFASCQKFLDKKPATDLVVPTTLDDFVKLMDNYPIMNSSPNIGEVSSDDYFVPTKVAWDAIGYIHQRNAYIFNPNFEEGSSSMPDWDNPYKQIFISNIVLDGLSNIDQNGTNLSEWNFVKGWALFMRSYAFFNLAQLFSPAYDPKTADVDLGIPLRLLPGVDEKYQRASLAQTYEQILKDMNIASQLLPPELPSKNRNRPCKVAAYGALSRIYLAMREYRPALENANLCLALYNQLLDYNDLVNLPNPFLVDINNEETIWQSELGYNDLLFYRNLSPNTLVDSSLYNSYKETDLRKSFFFSPSASYPGKANRNWGYAGGSIPFGGLAVDEILLIKAECLIRNSQISEGLEVLNMLLRKRYKNDSYIPYQMVTYDEALETLLLERRKELVFRGLRWQDLRRLNKEGFNITVIRNLDGNSYELPPNSNLYTLPIPSEEIRLNGLIQNIRP